MNSILRDFDKKNEMPCTEIDLLKREIEDLKNRSKEDAETIKAFTERYTNDCIRINQLQTTIDVLIDKCARLRDIKGL